MRKKTAALFNPYIDTLGGGERHILSILKVLTEYDYFPVIYWDDDLSEKIHTSLQIKFPLPLEFKNNIFKNNTTDVFHKYKELRTHDIFLYVTDGSYFFSGAKKNFIFCMVPQKSLYNRSFLNKIKTGNYRFISNSHYTAGWLKKWGIDSEVIYPYIHDDFFNQNNEKKEKIILSVGRFFKHLHSKRQDLAIEYFLELQKNSEMFKEYKLILAGSVKPEDKDYIHELEGLTQNNKNIEFRTNISFDELLKLYKKSKYYWHMAGINIDAEKEPEKAEHLGISPLEAMAGKCIVLGYNAGGLKEIIKNKETGFLFSTHEELMKDMIDIENKNETQKLITANAYAFVSNTFSYDTFKKRVEDIMV